MNMCKFLILYIPDYQSIYLFIYTHNLTYGSVDAVDPLDVPGHDLDTGLLRPAHVLVEQMVSLNR